MTTKQWPRNLYRRDSKREKASILRFTFGTVYS